jgi:ubiquinone/menaquinone biosynthesis C-methylase UbiE
MITALDRLHYVARQSARVGWYMSHYAAAEGFREKGTRQRRDRSGPMPSREEMFSDLVDVFRLDLGNAAAGVYPLPRDHDGGFADTIARSRRFFADLPAAARRRREGNGREILDLDIASALPDYFVHNFHYQTGGYLTRDSAELYDLQVEVLFSGSTNAMRRQCLVPIFEFLRGRDQRRMSLMDAACGSGRFLRFVKEAFPRLEVHGCDLSAAYLEEATSHIRPYEVTVTCANAERLPDAGECFDIVTSQFLFHEVPPDVRRTITGEFARVLRPGGLMVFMDSLQVGDRENYDGLLRAFPALFHEPYYDSYLEEDLEGMFADVGLRVTMRKPVFLSKLIVCEKTL